MPDPSIKRFQTMVANIPVGAAIIRGQRALFMSDYMFELTGYTEEELMDLNRCLIFVAPEEQERVQAFMKANATDLRIAC